MRNEFYKVTCNLDVLDGDVYLIFLEEWLEKKWSFLRILLIYITDKNGK